MDYFAASINESPVIAMKAGAALDEVGGKAIAFNADGNAVLAGGGSDAIGVALLSNDETIPAGGRVDVQYKDIGLVQVSAAVAPGDRLAPGEGGTLAKTTSGAYLAIALQQAPAPGAMVQAIIERGSLASAPAGSGTSPKENE